MLVRNEVQNTRKTSGRKLDSITWQGWRSIGNRPATRADVLAIVILRLADFFLVYAKCCDLTSPDIHTDKVSWHPWPDDVLVRRYPLDRQVGRLGADWYRVTGGTGTLRCWHTH